jgi:phosphohistidine phosphatase
MRHAKAEAWASSDHVRRLTDRGVREAAEAGRWARTAEVLPDHAFVSTAARAEETWSAFRQAAELDLEAELDAGLYSAGPDSALEILRTAPAQARAVMIVGHNPTMAHLVHLLDDGRGEPAALAEISAGFPTSAVAVLEIEGPWGDLDVAAGRIVAVHVRHD